MKDKIAKAPGARGKPKGRGEDEARASSRGPLEVLQIIKNSNKNNIIIIIIAAINKMPLSKTPSFLT